MIDVAWFRWSRWCGLVGTAFFGFLVGAPPARASYPVSFYSVPSKVELLPNDASATRVIIHGALIKLTPSMDYSQPACGVLHFACKPGEEIMCRMQWMEIRNAVSSSPTVCTGFGTENMVSNATIYAEGASVGSADTWDIGMGVTSGIYVENRCPAALALKCAAGSPSDGSAPADDAGSGGAPVVGTGGTGGGTGGAAGSGTGGKAGAGTGGASGGGTGGAMASAVRNSGGCTVAAGGLPLAPGLIAGAGGLLVVAAMRRRRRRR
jgi:hypothetical protein